MWDFVGRLMENFFVAHDHKNRRKVNVNKFYLIIFSWLLWIFRSCLKYLFKIKREISKLTRKQNLISNKTRKLEEKEKETSNLNLPTEVRLKSTTCWKIKRRKKEQQFLLFWLKKTRQKSVTLFQPFSVVRLKLVWRWERFHIFKRCAFKMVWCV